MATLSPAASDTPAGNEPYERRWWALGVLGLSLILIGLDNTILNVALPTLVREISATNSQLQWIIDSYVLVFAGLLLTAGSLGDRFGRKGALNAGLAVFLAGAVASAFAETANQLIATRAIMGIGGAFIMPSTLSILTNMFPPHERGRAIGLWAGMAGVGIPLGPLLGGWLLEHFHWSAIFTVNIPIVLAALALGQWLLPTSRDPRAPKVDVPGAVLSMAGLSALIYGIIEAPLHGWTAPATLAALGAAAAFLVAFAWWEVRTREPMLDMRFFRNPRFSAANASITLVFFAMFGSLLSLTQYLQFIQGYTPFEAGLRMLPMALGLMVGGPLSARLDERLGSKVVVTAGLVVVAGGLLMLSRLDVESGYASVGGALFVMAAGMALSMAPSTEAVMGAIPRSKAGVGSAMNDTTRQVGGALGVAIIGSVMSSAYRSDITAATAGLPAEAASAASDSLGAALHVASGLGPAGAALAEAARIAFVDSMAIGLAVGALVALLGAAVAATLLPARGIDAGDDFEDAR